ncbi:unnamed protein product [Echinostoma caproni]|uniref:Uncharacterized protein n=1 Tax=Echinostoma caproni TaxID=27848 RepID=A0A183AJL1_9TREM|nr:unnamed protein product [Echinostoma caproni]
MQAGSKDPTGLDNPGSEAGISAALSGSGEATESSNQTSAVSQNVPDGTNEPAPQSSSTQLSAAASFFTRYVLYTIFSLRIN